MCLLAPHIGDLESKYLRLLAQHASGDAGTCEKHPLHLLEPARPLPLRVGVHQLEEFKNEHLHIPALPPSACARAGQRNL